MEASATTNKKSKQTEVVAKWASFQCGLVGVLKLLTEDQFLIISKKRTNIFVQAVAQGSHGMRVETTSNFYRDDAHQLSPTQVAKLVKMGWNMPTGDDSSPETDPLGSPNFFLDVPQPVDFEAVAALMVRTLSELVTHTGYLEYEGCDSKGNSLSFPALGLKSASAGTTDPNVYLQQLLLSTVREITGDDELAIDGDGDIGPVPFGSSFSYIKILQGSQYLRLFSIVARDVDESPALLAKLNQLNGEHGYFHVYWEDGVVVALADVAVVPFVKMHLALVLPQFCEFADYSKSVLSQQVAGCVEHAVVH